MEHHHEALAPRAACRAAPPAPMPNPQRQHHHLEGLPPELLISALSYLPGRDVLRVESTSGRICTILRDPAGPASTGVWRSLVGLHFPWALPCGGSASDDDEGGRRPDENGADAAARDDDASSAGRGTTTTRRRRRRCVAWPVPHRTVFLYLRNLRFRPYASIEAHPPHHHPDHNFASSSSVRRTPSLRSLPQRWLVRSSPFSRCTAIAGPVSPLSIVEECEVASEPAALPVARGDPELVRRYNVAVLESGVVASASASASAGSSFHRTCAFEIDLEVCFAGRNGGLLGVVACDRDTRSEAVRLGEDGPCSNNDFNVWFFDFSPRQRRWHDDDDDRGPCFRREVRCNGFEGWTADGGDDGSNDASLARSESPTESPQRFRLHLDPNCGQIELHLLDGRLEVKRHVCRFGSNNIPHGPNNDWIRRMVSLFERGWEFRPFVGFSPLEPDWQVHPEPERSFAKVLRVMPL